MARQGWCEDPIHRTRIALGERLQRELQQQAQRRDIEHGNLLHIEGGKSADREMATPLQHGQVAQFVGLQTTRSGNRVAKR